MKNLISTAFPALLFSLLFLSGCAYKMPGVPYEIPMEDVTDPLSVIIDINNCGRNAVLYNIYYYDDDNRKVQLLKKKRVFPRGRSFSARVPLGYLTIVWKYETRSNKIPREITKSILITHRRNRVTLGFTRGRHGRGSYRPALY